MKPLYIKDLIYVGTRKTSYRTYRTTSQYLCITDYCSNFLSYSFQKISQIYCAYQFHVALCHECGGSYPTKELYAETASGAAQLERLRYAAFLQKETGLPILTTGYSLIGISEGDLMAKELNQFFNVPTQWIENKARNTEENASFTKNILVKDNIQKIILVTNQWHMKRAKYLFEKQGFDVLPAAAANYGSKGNLSAKSFVPDLGALNSNMVLLKEWIGYWKAHYAQ